MDSDLFTTPVNEELKQIIKQKEAFDCCSSYYECSVEKKCVNQNEELSQKCRYKTHLDAGRIYYSKNAIDFSMQKYHDISEKYNSIDTELKLYFNNILHYFLHHKRLLEYDILLRNKQLDSLVEKGFLFNNRTFKYSVLKLFNFKYIKSLLSKKVNIRQKDDLIKHIIETDPQAMECLYEKYIYVQFDRNLFAYYEEIYLDNHIRDNITPDNFKHFLSTITPLKKDILQS